MIVVWTSESEDGTMLDCWVKCDSDDTAQQLYLDVLNDPDTYTASLCKVVASTDYDREL